MKTMSESRLSPNFLVEIGTDDTDCTDSRDFSSCNPLIRKISANPQVAWGGTSVIQTK
jgi:hypothetical protein